MLKIHYLCGWNDNIKAINLLHIPVVICSKFITFVVEMTTNSYICACLRRLWFAQNSLPLWLKWQPIAGRKKHPYVVICSKFITFVVEMTTYCALSALSVKLWFAQNSLPLWLKWQRFWAKSVNYPSCDLLKIHYLCGWNDNRTEINNNKNKLWFAQNSLPLWLKWQQSGCRSLAP